MAKIVLFEKLESGELKQMDEREWDDSLAAMLNYANYLMLGGREYEMVEGRLNVDENRLELLLVKAEKE